MRLLAPQRAAATSGTLCVIMRQIMPGSGAATVGPGTGAQIQAAQDYGRPSNVATRPGPAPAGLAAGQQAGKFW